LREYIENRYCQRSCSESLEGKEDRGKKRLRESLRGELAGKALVLVREREKLESLDEDHFVSPMIV
jgi:hypothetical protein